LKILHEAETGLTRPNDDDDDDDDNDTHIIIIRTATRYRLDGPGIKYH